MSSRRALAGRAGWGLLDQALSSLTNFGLGVVVARNVSAEDFGAFSLAWATFLIILNLSRAIATEPLLIRFSGPDGAPWHEGARSATGSALLVGLLAAAGCLVVALVTTGPVAGSFAALAVVLPGLLVHDCLRFAFVARGDPRTTFLLDLAWAVGLVPAVVAIDRLLQGTSAVVPILAWGGTAAVAGVIGLAIARIAPDPRRFGWWFDRQRDLVPRFVVESLTGTGASQAIVFVVGVFAGLEGAGALRAAQLLLGPMQILFMAITLIAIPEAVRILATSEERFRRAAVLLAAGMSATVVLWTVAASLLPDSIGSALLGETWPEARPVIVPLGLALAGLAAGSAAGIGLRARADARGSLRARSIDASANVVLGTIGAVAAGALGAAWGQAAGAAIGATAYWLIFRAGQRRIANRVVPAVTE